MTNEPTFSIADLAGMLAGILSDEPYDLDEDQAVRMMSSAFDADPTGPFDGVASSFAYMINNHPSYTDQMRDELITAVHDEIAAIYEDDDE